MRKTLATATLLCALALPASAAFDVNTVCNRAFEDPNIPATWPIAATCVAEDVNLRSTCSLDSNVVGSISNPQEIYIHDCTMENPYEGYSWVVASSYDGKKCWANSKFFSVPEKNYTRAERFRALFNSMVYWTDEALTNSFDITDKGTFVPIHEDYKRLNHPFLEKVKEVVPGVSSYGADSLDDGKYIQMLVKVTTPNYSVAGLKINDNLSGDTLTQFDSDMQSIGWEKYKYDEEYNRYTWYMDKRAPGSDYGPFRGFWVTVHNNFITDIIWFTNYYD